MGAVHIIQHAKRMVAIQLQHQLISWFVDYSIRSLDLLITWSGARIRDNAFEQPVVVVSAPLCGVHPSCLFLRPQAVQFCEPSISNVEHEPLILVARGRRRLLDDRLLQVTAICLLIVLELAWIWNVWTQWQQWGTMAVSFPGPCSVFLLLAIWKSGESLVSLLT